MTQLLSCKIGHHCHLAATRKTIQSTVSKSAANLNLLLNFPKYTHIPYTHYPLTDEENNCLDDG